MTPAAFRDRMRAIALTPERSFMAVDARALRLMVDCLFDGGFADGLNIAAGAAAAIPLGPLIPDVEPMYASADGRQPPSSSSPLAAVDTVGIEAGPRREGRTE